MQSEQSGSTNGPGTPPPASSSGDSRELRELRATCRRQAAVIASLRAAVENIHRGAKALKAENSELRGDNDRMDVAQRSRMGANGRIVIGEPLEVGLPLDMHAPGAARAAVAKYLDALAAASLLDRAQLLISELVTNSVRHSGAAADARLTLRVNLGPAWCRMEVEDPGCDGVIAPRPADAVNGGGLGLNLVQTLSERWGLERGGKSGTRVWAELSRAPVSADAGLEAYGAPPLAPHPAL